jgi:hypothetical protein
MAITIIRQYQFNVAWYAQVDLDVANETLIVELKIRTAQQPTNTQWRTLAQNYKNAILAERLRQKEAQEAREAKMQIDLEPLANMTLQRFATKLTNKLTANPGLRNNLVGNTFIIGVQPNGN